MTRKRPPLTLMERIETAAANLGTAALVALGGGVMWLIRSVLTNQRKIGLLEQEISHRDQQRTEDREALKAVRDAVVRIETKLMGGK